MSLDRGMDKEDTCVHVRTRARTHTHTHTLNEILLNQKKEIMPFVEAKKFDGHIKNFKMGEINLDFI